VVAAAVAVVAGAAVVVLGAAVQIQKQDNLLHHNNCAIIPKTQHNIYTVRIYERFCSTATNAITKVILNRTRSLQATCCSA